MTPNGYKLFRPAEPGTYNWTVFDRKKQKWTDPETVELVAGQRGLRVQAPDQGLIDLSDFHKTGYMAWKSVD